MRRYFAGTGASHRERQDRCGSTRGSHDRSFFYKEAHFGRSCIPAADEWRPPGGHPASGYPPGVGRFPQPVQRCGENLPVSVSIRGKRWHAFRRKYACHYTAPLDLAAMERAARYPEGTHDFSSFTIDRTPGKSKVRTIRAIRMEQHGPSAADPV